MEPDHVSPTHVGDRERSQQGSDVRIDREPVESDRRRLPPGLDVFLKKAIRNRGQRRRATGHVLSPERIVARRNDAE